MSGWTLAGLTLLALGEVARELSSNVLSGAQLARLLIFAAATGAFLIAWAHQQGVI